MRINSKNIFFILVEPKSPGNIGAAARALKTMGFQNLILINPGNYQTPEAQWMAHASEEVLKKATVLPSLKEAAVDKHFVVATTQRERSSHLPYYHPEQLAEKIIPITAKHRVALVFGREQTGLTNEEISFCDAVSTIPSHTHHPSLNLSQAVMIYCYELFRAAYGELKKYHWRLATHQELESLYNHLQQSLMRVGFVPIDSWENFILRFSRLLGRANTEIRDVRVWHKILDSFDQYFNQLERNKSDLDDEK
jgi:TrmH family RNA methyltransferase